MLVLFYGSSSLYSLLLCIPVFFDQNIFFTKKNLLLFHTWASYFFLIPSEPIRSSHGKSEITTTGWLKQKKKMNLKKTGKNHRKKCTERKGLIIFFQIGRLMQKKRRHKHVWPKDRAATLGIVRIEKESSRTRASDLHTQDEGQTTTADSLSICLRSLGPGIKRSRGMDCSSQFSTWQKRIAQRLSSGQKGHSCRRFTL